MYTTGMGTAPQEASVSNVDELRQAYRAAQAEGYEAGRKEALAYRTWRAMRFQGNKDRYEAAQRRTDEAGAKARAALADLKAADPEALG